MRSTLRVEVSDPSSEGSLVAAALRQAGLEVSSIELIDVPLTEADLVVLAGDAEGALGALKLLRDDGLHGDVPVILLGVPAGTSHRGDGEPGFGADAVLRRPVELDALVDCALELTEPVPGSEHSGVGLSPVERTMRLSGPSEPDSSQVLLRADEVDDAPRPSWRPREPTMQLDAAHVEDVSAVRRGSPSSHPPTTGGGRRPASEVSSSPGTGSRPGTGSHPEVPELVIPPEERAQISPWLEALLASADRRVFPDRPPLALHFPAADEPPEELVPAELFEAGSFRLDEPVIDDPIDAFTFVGGPAVPPPVQAGTAEEPVPTPATDPGRGERGGSKTSMEIPERVLTFRQEHTTATELPEPTPTPGSGVHPAPLGAASQRVRGGDWPEDDPVLGRPSERGDRRGTLGPGGVLRLLWRIATLGLDGLCELDGSGGAQARLTFLAGELRAFEGAVAVSVLDQLRRLGRATEHAADEAAAEAILQRHVASGELGRFERDRMLREEREALLGRLVASERAELTLQRLDDTQPGRVLSRARVFSRPLRAALVAAAREVLPVERVKALLGPVGLSLGPEREAGLTPAELPSEVVELVLRLEGRTLEDFLAAAPTEPGLAGVLYALVAADALVPTEAPREARPALEVRARLGALVDAAARLAEDGDYFSILGLEPGAGVRDVERAYRLRRDELAAVPLASLGLHDLIERRDEALEAVEEARWVLSDEARRRLYAAALG